MKRNLARLPGLLLACVLLGACASRPPPELPDRLFDDGAFDAAAVAVDPGSVVALSAPMRRYADELIRPKMRLHNVNTGLYEALYKRGHLQLRYDTGTTRSASEAFEDRAGNCLSLVLMTAAFARELGVPVRFQSVQVEQTHARDGDLLLFVGHINIALGRHPGLAGLGHSPSQWLIVDFLPGADISRQRHVTIDESTVLAMYMNNKAAEAIARGRLDDAYAWVRGAIAQDRGFAPAYNTLGVVYLRRGKPDYAERALRHALAHADDNAPALSNLVQALQRQDRFAEANDVADRLRRVQPSTPFAHFEAGQHAMHEGRWQLAREHFERAIRRDGDFHEFHFALAQVLARQGDVDGAAKALERAREASTTDRLQSQYAGKIARLRAQLTH